MIHLTVSKTGKFKKFKKNNNIQLLSHLQIFFTDYHLKNAKK